MQLVLTANPSSATADGVSPIALTVSATDSAGQPLASHTVTFTSSEKIDLLVPPQVVTDITGSGSILVSSTKAGSHLIVARLYGSSATTQINFTAGSLSTSSQFVLDATPLTSDGLTASTGTVIATDTHGNPVAHTTVVITSSDPTDIITLVTPSTNDAGELVFTVRATQPGTKTITAVLGGLTLRQTLVVLPPNASSVTSTLTFVPASVVADGTTSSILLLTVRDAHSRLMQNVNVVLSASGSNTSFGSLAGVSDTAGQFTTTVSSTTAQTENISAALGHLSPAPTVTAPLTFVPGPSSSVTSTLVINPSSNTADGTSYVTLTVTARDAHGNLIPNASVVFTSSGTNNTITPASGTSDANGVWSSHMSSTIAQSETVSASITP